MIYLDYQATTPLAPEAYAAMRPWLEDGFANPHSPHRPGRAAKAAVEVARAQVLKALLPSGSGLFAETGGWDERNGYLDEDTSEPQPTPAVRRPYDTEAGKLYFTSGATEAANWAITGTWRRQRADRPKVVTIATEHACVLDTCLALEREGAEVVVLPVGPNGRVDLKVAATAIDSRTAVVAAMLVNNEIGVIQPIHALGELATAAGATMFCDAVQGWGRVGLPLWACDLVAVSAHKVHGPKGVGALWVRDGHMPDPLLHGGGQEGGARSGTLSPALCAGFGAAAALLEASSFLDDIHAHALWHVAWSTLTRVDWQLNGESLRRYHGNLNVRMAGLDVNRLMSDLRDIAFSAGSACASGSGRPSHVLRAIGLSEAEARSSIRLGWGRYTTEAELAEACARIDAAARAQRR